MIGKEADLMRLLVRLGVLTLLMMVPVAGIQAKEKTVSGQQEPTIDLSQPLTLENAIKIGLQYQNTLAIARSRLDASKARVTRAMSSYYPQIAPSFEYSSQFSSFRIGGQRQTTTVEQSVTQIGLRQLIFDMGRREENVLVSRYSARASEYDVLDARQDVIVNVSTAYYDLLRRKELVRVAQASVDRAQTTLEATRAFAEAGTAPKKDILQAEADLENARVQLIVAQNDVRLAQTSLKNAMGILTPLPLLTPDTPLDPPPGEPDARTAADYVKLAFDTRLDLKRDMASIDANRHNVKIANIDAGLFIQADFTEGYRIDPDPGENRAFITTFSYPLFDAGATRAQVREAKANLEQARRQLELSRQNIQLEVEQAYLLREEARARIAATQAALRAAQLNFEAAREAQKEGAGDIIEVITAQTQLVTAETNVVQAIYDFYTNDARLRRAIGDNDPYVAGERKR